MTKSGNSVRRRVFLTGQLCVQYFVIVFWTVRRFISVLKKTRNLFWVSNQAYKTEDTLSDTSFRHSPSSCLSRVEWRQLATDTDHPDSKSVCKASVSWQGSGHVGKKGKGRVRSPEQHGLFLLWGQGAIFFCFSFFGVGQHFWCCGGEGQQTQGPPWTRKAPAAPLQRSEVGFMA